MSEHLAPAGATRVHGVRIDPMELDEAITTVVGWGRDTSRTRSRVVHPLPADPTVLARRDAQFRDLLNRSDLNVADGKGVVWAIRALDGVGPRDRVYGPDLMAGVLAAGGDLRHAFLGGADQEVLAAVVAAVTAAHGVTPVAAHAPPHREVSDAAVAEDVAALDLHGPADVLWVGLGTPKQQRWADHARHLHPAHVIVTVGAAFDFLAGRVRQAPPWMQSCGLEWLHRLGQDPRRLWRRYLEGNARHVAGVAADRFRARASASRP